MLAQIAFVDLAQPKQRNGALALAAERGLSPEHRGQAAKIPLFLQEARQLTQGTQILGLDLHRFLQTARGCLPIAQLLFLEASDAQQGLGPERGIGHASLPGLLQVHQLWPALLFGEELDERELGVGIAGNLGKDGLGEALQVDRIVHVGHQQAKTAAQKVQPLLGAGTGLSAHALSLDQEREQHVPFLGLAAQAFQIGTNLGVGRDQSDRPARTT